MVSRSLKKTGLAEIMVYDHANRQYSIRMQKMLAILDPDKKLSAPQRFELALGILRSANDHVSKPAELGRVLRLVDTSPNFRRELADFISHPQENYYDVFSLVDILHKTGLAPRSWKMPHLFDPTFLLSDDTLHPLIEDLNITSRTQLGYLLSTWLLEVFVGKTNMEPPLTDALAISIEADTVVRSIDQTKVFRFDPDGELIGEDCISKLSIKNDVIYMDAGERRPAVSSYGRAVDCVLEHPRKLLKLTDLGFTTPLSSKNIMRMIFLAKDPIRISQLATALLFECGNSCEFAQEDVLELCRYLMKPPFRVLAVA